MLFHSAQDKGQIKTKSAENMCSIMDVAGATI